MCASCVIQRELDFSYHGLFMSWRHRTISGIFNTLDISYYHWTYRIFHTTDYSYHHCTFHTSFFMWILDDHAPLQTSHHCWGVTLSWLENERFKICDRCQMSNLAMAISTDADTNSDVACLDHLAKWPMTWHHNSWTWYQWSRSAVSLLWRHWPLYCLLSLPKKAEK